MKNVVVSNEKDLKEGDLVEITETYTSVMRVRKDGSFVSVKGSCRETRSFSVKRVDVNS